jgi:histone deacetylase 11
LTIVFNLPFFPANSGGGFCVYADLTLSIRHLQTDFPDRVKKVLLIDLDAHQGKLFLACILSWPLLDSFFLFCFPPSHLSLVLSFSGNGHETDFINDDSVFVLDLYNPLIYPGDEYAKQGMRCLFPACS